MAVMNGKWFAAHGSRFFMIVPGGAVFNFTADSSGINKA
ncbi:hypothetical protein CEV33_1602 [Brucella grignonensis]|uniref:Uncharacterized protein n=1 Tax=Brucella grignonensis TaxID=94627 RepID=A0A256FB44_9HYPH|nr:hypothetical protein CEV33_1602 [Brucella grignonensis]